MVTRKFPRYPTEVPSVLVQRDRLRYNASVRDVSIKGCRVESVIRPFTGMQLEISIQLPGEATPIVINQATVRWTGSHGIGIEFLSIPDAQKARLTNYIAQLSIKAGTA
jgi:hypothetical protein